MPVSQLSSHTTSQSTPLLSTSPVIQPAPQRASRPDVQPVSPWLSFKQQCIHPSSEPNIYQSSHQLIQPFCKQTSNVPFRKYTRHPSSHTAIQPDNQPNITPLSNVQQCSQSASRPNSNAIQSNIRPVDQSSTHQSSQPANNSTKQSYV